MILRQHPVWALDVPRKGNVDRNVNVLRAAAEALATFPARGTWIEIIRLSSTSCPTSRRSPQGERG